MNRIITPRRDLILPSKRLQRGSMILDAYRFGGGAGSDTISFANVVLQIHPTGVAGGTAITDSSGYARTLTRVGSPVLATQAGAPGGVGFQIPGSSGDRYTCVPGAEMRLRAGAFQIDWAMVLPVPGIGLEHTILCMTDGSYGVAFEWAAMVKNDCLRFYWGTRGSNQAELQFQFPTGKDMNDLAGSRVKLRIARDVSGYWGAWVNGALCPTYKFSALSSGTSLGASTAAPAHNATDFGAVTFPILNIGNFFVNIGGLTRTFDEVRFVVGESCDIGSDYAPLTSAFPDS